MSRRLENPANQRKPLPVVMAAFFAIAVCTTVPASESGGASSISADVSFDPECASAEIRSSGRVSALVVVLTDDSRERITGLEPASSYIVRLAPAAIAAGKQIRTVSAYRGDPPGSTSSGVELNSPDTISRCDSAASKGRSRSRG